MADLPKRITIVEEGVREGCQSHNPPLQTAQKLALIKALVSAGITNIQVALMVNPRLVPGWADAEDVLEHLPMPDSKTHYRALWLNKKGFDRAWAYREKLSFAGAVTAYASDAFLLKNQNATQEKHLEEQKQVVASYKEKGIPIDRIGVLAAFGCNFQGAIPVARVIESASSAMALAEEQGSRISQISLVDTMAWGTPESVKRLVGSVREHWPDLNVSLHLHNTRGMGIANAYAGLEMGVNQFDASVAGLGGCPFAGHKGAAGNVCTEDLVFMCHEMGIDTGIDLERLIEVARSAEDIFGKTLNGSVMKAGSLARFKNNP